MRFTVRALSAMALASATLALVGCGSLNNQLAEKTKQVEYYRIFDIKTTADRRTIANAASNGLGRNVNNAQEATPIPGGAIPATPGRFQLVSPFAGTGLGAFAAAGGSVGLRIATCEGAVWTAKAQRRIDHSDNLNLTLCLFQYQGGYHLDMYAVFQKQSGGILQLGRDMAHAMVGKPEEWTERTMLDVARSIYKQTGADIKLLEAEPGIAGTPWLSDFDR